MAYLNNTAPITAGVAARISHLQQSWAAWQRQRQAYRQTLAELSALNDRELNDLGFSRADIPAIARDAAASA